MKVDENAVNNPVGLQADGIPAWMLSPSKAVENESSAINIRFLRNSLLNLSKLVCNEVFSERYVERNGLLQSIDPRVKLLTALFFILLGGLTRSIMTLLFLSCVASMYVRLSELSLKDYFKRVWMVYPLIYLIMSVPAATSIFIPGKQLLYVYHNLDVNLLFIRLPREVYFSYEGIAAVIKMALRLGVAFSFGYILVLTTSWSCLTRSLTIMRVPLLAVSVLNMTYRYIYVLSKTAMEMFEARILRTVGKIHNKENRFFMAGRISFLFIKSYYLSDEVYDAMRCRGYTGEPVSLSPFALRRADYLWMVSNLIITLIIGTGEVLF